MRFKFLSHSLVLALVVTATGCAAPADDAETEGTSSDAISGSFPAGTKLEATESLNQRAEPRQSSALQQVIPRGTIVLSGAARPVGGWHEVTWNGKTGWVVANYLESSSTPESQAGAAAGAAGVSERGQRQMRGVVAYGDAHNGGASRGRCFEYVWKYLSASGYGAIDSYGDAADMPSAYARNFAEYMNVNGNAARWGLQRLALDNPYDAPVGAVVVVAAGSPGTAHPTAGDISIAAGGGRFINDGPRMGYGGSRGAFRSGGGRVLGIYAPR